MISRDRGVQVSELTPLGSLDRLLCWDYSSRQGGLGCKGKEDMRD